MVSTETVLINFVATDNVSTALRRIGQNVALTEAGIYQLKTSTQTAGFIMKRAFTNVAIAVGAVSAALVASLSNTVKANAEIERFENLISTISNQSIENVSKSIKTLTLALPNTTTEIANLQYEIAKLGVGEDLLDGITKNALILGNVFGYSSEKLGTILTMAARLDGDTSMEQINKKASEVAFGFANSALNLTKLEYTMNRAQGTFKTLGFTFEDLLTSATLVSKEANQTPSRLGSGIMLFANGIAKAKDKLGKIDYKLDSESIKKEASEIQNTINNLKLQKLEMEKQGNTKSEEYQSLTQQIKELSILKSNLFTARKNADDFAKSYKSMIYDSSGNMLAFNKILYNLGEHFSKITDKSERLATIQEVFGRDGATTILTLLDNYKEYDKLLNQVKQSAEETGDKQSLINKMNEKYNKTVLAQFGLISSRIQVIGKNIYEYIHKPLVNFLTILSDGLGDLAKDDNFTTMMGDIYTIILNVAGVLADNLITGIKNFSKYIVDNKDSINDMMSSVDGLVKSLVDLYNSIMSVIYNALGDLNPFESLKLVIDKIKEIITTLNDKFNTFKDKIKSATDNIKNMVKSNKDLIATIISIVALLTGTNGLISLFGYLSGFKFDGITSLGNSLAGLTIISGAAAIATQTTDVNTQNNTKYNNGNVDNTKTTSNNSNEFKQNDKKHINNKQDDVNKTTFSDVLYAGLATIISTSIYKGFKDSLKYIIFPKEVNDNLLKLEKAIAFDKHKLDILNTKRIQTDNRELKHKTELSLIKDILKGKRVDVTGKNVDNKNIYRNIEKVLNKINDIETKINGIETIKNKFKTDPEYKKALKEAENLYDLDKTKKDYTNAVRKVDISFETDTLNLLKSQKNVNLADAELKREVINMLKLMSEKKGGVNKLTDAEIKLLEEKINLLGKKNELIKSKEQKEILKTVLSRIRNEIDDIKSSRKTVSDYLPTKYKKEYKLTEVDTTELKVLKNALKKEYDEYLNLIKDLKDATKNKLSEIPNQRKGFDIQEKYIKANIKDNEAKLLKEDGINSVFRETKKLFNSVNNEIKTLLSYIKSTNIFKYLNKELNTISDTIKSVNKNFMKLNSSLKSNKKYTSKLIESSDMNKISKSITRFIVNLLKTPLRIKKIDKLSNVKNLKSDYYISRTPKIDYLGAQILKYIKNSLSTLKDTSLLKKITSGLKVTSGIKVASTIPIKSKNALYGIYKALNPLIKTLKSLLPTIKPLTKALKAGLKILGQVFVILDAIFIAYEAFNIALYSMKTNLFGLKTSFEFVGEVFNEQKGNIMKALTLIGGAFDLIYKSIAGAIVGISSFVIPIVGGIAGGVLDVLGTVYDSVLYIAGIFNGEGSGTFDMLKEVSEYIGIIGVAIGTDLYNKLKNISKTIKFVTWVTGGAIQIITKSWKWLIKWLEDNFGFIINPIVGGFRWVYDKITEIFKNIKSPVKSFESSLVWIGKLMLDVALLTKQINKEDYKKSLKQLEDFMSDKPKEENKKEISSDEYKVDSKAKESENFDVTETEMNNYDEEYYYKYVDKQTKSSDENTNAIKEQTDAIKEQTNTIKDNYKSKTSFNSNDIVLLYEGNLVKVVKKGHILDEKPLYEGDKDSIKIIKDKIVVIDKSKSNDNNTNKYESENIKKDDDISNKDESENIKKDDGVITFDPNKTIRVYENGVAKIFGKVGLTKGKLLYEGYRNNVKEVPGKVVVDGVNEVNNQENYLNNKNYIYNKDETTNRFVEAISGLTDTLSITKDFVTNTLNSNIIDLKGAIVDNTLSIKDLKSGIKKLNNDLKNLKVEVVVKEKSSSFGGVND